MLEEVMVFSAAEAATAYETTARALRGTATGGDWASAAIEAVHRIADQLAIKSRLRDLGVHRDQLPAIAADAVADAVTRNTPRPPSQSETLDLLQSVY